MIIKDLYYGAKLRAKSIDDMTFCQEIDKWVETEKLIKHNEHQDYPFSHCGAVFSLNSCDGGTFIQNEFVKAEENRIVLFDPFTPHSSTTCTDAQARFNINLNWK